jgi:hypothetical protein
MDKPMLNTTYDFPLIDGSTVKLTLAFYYLYQLRSQHRDLYNRYNKIMQSSQGQNFDIVDMVTICYVGYVCANMNAENVLSEEDFYMMCGSDITEVGKAVKHLINPKKQKASANRS